MKGNLNLRLVLLALLAFGAATPAPAQSVAGPQANPQLAEAERLHRAGYEHFVGREYREALAAFVKELPLRRAAGDTVGEAWALNQIGESYLSLHEYGPALEHYSRALPLFRQTKTTHGEARTLHALAACQRALGNSAQALEHLKELLPLVRASEDRLWEGMVLGDTADTYLELGEKERALEFLLARLAYERGRGSILGEADALEALRAASGRTGREGKVVAPPREDAPRIGTARKLHEYLVAPLRSHSEQMLIWAVLDEVKDEPEDLRLFVIGYGPLPGSARRHAERVRNYWVKAHGVLPSRVVAVDGGLRPERSVEVWAVPAGAAEPVPTPRGSFTQGDSAAWKYDDLWLQGWWFVSEYEKEAERLDGFAAALKSNPASKGYIIVHRETVDCDWCLRVGSEMKFAAQEKEYLVRKHQLAPARITLVRAGGNGSGRMQLWVVPPGARLSRAQYNSPPRG